MRRHALAATVVVIDVFLHVAGKPSPIEGVLYALAALAVVLVGHRWATAGFVGGLALAAVSGGALVLMLWVAYQTGRDRLPRSGLVIVVAAALGATAGQVVLDPRSWLQVMGSFLVFVALPFLSGRYVAQHERLLSTLEQNSRLRLARDMHDSLGRRLSLVSLQAAALEVAELPQPHRQAVARLAASAREAMDELYEVIGTLRGTEGRPPPGLDAIDRMVADFIEAGVAVTVHRRGQPQPLAQEATEGAYRVIEEGLTNAAKHAAGQPVQVQLAWEADALLVTVVNRMHTDQLAVGHGLIGLRERVGELGGFVDHRADEGQFRLAAMLPLASVRPATARVTAVAIGVAVLMFALLPATMVVGVTQ